MCRAFNSSGPAPKFKSLTLTEKIGGVEKDVQYFPVAGDSLSSDITFYKADGACGDIAGLANG